MTRDEGRRLHIVQIEEVRPVSACNLESVAKSLRRNQPDLDALALRQGIDHDRRAVRQEINSLQVRFSPLRRTSIMPRSYSGGVVAVFAVLTVDRPVP